MVILLVYHKIEFVNSVNSSSKLIVTNQTKQNVVNLFCYNEKFYYPDGAGHKETDFGFNYKLFKKNHRHFKIK
jgi:hypothetical protein